jgi:hypothetical protein
MRDALSGYLSPEETSGVCRRRLAGVSIRRGYGPRGSPQAGGFGGVAHVAAWNGSSCGGIDGDLRVAAARFQTAL